MQLTIVSSNAGIMLSQGSDDRQLPRTGCTGSSPGFVSPVLAQASYRAAHLHTQLNPVSRAKAWQACHWK